MGGKNPLSCLSSPRPLSSLPVSVATISVLPRVRSTSSRQPRMKNPMETKPGVDNMVMVRLRMPWS